MDNFDLRKYLAEGRMFDGKEVGVDNIIDMVIKDMDAKELGVEDGNEYLDKMIDRLEDLKINIDDLEEELKIN